MLLEESSCTEAYDAYDICHMCCHSVVKKVNNLSHRNNIKIIKNNQNIFVWYSEHRRSFKKRQVFWEMLSSWCNLTHSDDNIKNILLIMGC